MITYAFHSVGSGQPGPAERSQRTLGMLKARYVRGEISREQSEELKRDIG